MILSLLEFIFLLIIGSVFMFFVFMLGCILLESNMDESDSD